MFKLAWPAPTGEESDKHGAAQIVVGEVGNGKSGNRAIVFNGDSRFGAKCTVI